MKKAKYLEQIKFDVLNLPNWKEYNLKMVKIASVDKNTNLGGFDIEAMIKEKPEHLFIKIFAIKKDEVNDNGDAFSEVELKKAAKTFIGVPIFCNHQNDDIEKARGKCVHAWYDDPSEGIYIIAMVDRIAYPRLARGVEEGFISGTSMGCSVDHSCCSVCHQRASVADEYCDHIKNRKNKKFSGKIECQYHNSPCEPKDNCPVCGKMKDETRELEHKEAKIYEHNFDVKFIEDSFVVNPACHSCLVQEVFNVSELAKKVANLKELVVKLGSNCPTGTCSIAENKMIKEAGMLEIEYLTDAMEKIEKVAKSMMAQKANISLEYVSDLVETLANVQSIADELIEMGYAQLPSPDIIKADSDINLTKPAMPIVSPPVQSPVKTPSAPDISTQDIGGVGSITKPKISSIEEKKKEFTKVFGNLKDRLAILAEKIQNYPDNYNKLNIKESIGMVNNKVSEQGVIEKTAAHDTSVITEKQLDNAKFTGERTNISPEVITEKQLDKPKDVNVTTSETPQKRTGSPDVITEKQLEQIKSGYVVRWNDFPEVITEKQWTDASRLMGSLLSVDQTQVITEKQLNDFLSKHSYAELDVITEKQLEASKTEQTKRWANSKEIVKTAMEAISDTIAYYGKTPQEIKEAINYLTKSSKVLDKAAFVSLINALPNKTNEIKNDKQKFMYFSKLASTSVNTSNTVESLLNSVSSRLEKFSTDDIFSAIKTITASEKGMEQVENIAKTKMQSGIENVNEVDKVAQFENAINELNRPEDGSYQVLAGLSEIEAKPTDKKAFLKGVIKVAIKEINDNKVKVALTKVDIDEENSVVVATLKNVENLNEEEKKTVAQFDDWMNKDMELLEPKDSNIFDPTTDIDTETPEGIFADEDFFPTDEEDMAGLDIDPKEIDEEDNENLKLVRHGMPGMSTMDNPLTASRKENRENLVKEAQMFGGEMGGQAGASQGPGAGATLPTPPGAAPAGGTPPLESFEKSDMGADLAGDAEDMSAKPPGSLCPVCGSTDLDIIKGTGKCNNCGSEMVFEIDVKVTKWSGLTGEKEEEKEGEKETEGAGFEMPPTETPTAPPAAPAGAGLAEQPPAMASNKDIIKLGEFAEFTKLTPSSIKKLSESKIKLGSISPITGNSNTLSLGGKKMLCLDTGIPYELDYVVNIKNPKEIYARWIWNPTIKIACESCSRAKQSFVEALKKLQVTEEQFDALDIKEKGNTIIAMQNKGLLKQIKTASVKDSSVISEMKKAMTSLYGNKFPSEMCRQKLAIRFGKNAIALSGPCEGKPLYECVCNSLKKAGVYSNGLAIKVAEIWSDKDASSECMEDYVRMGFELKQASTICSSIKSKYAQMDDMLVDEMSNSVEPNVEEEPMVEENIVDIEPFSRENMEENMEEETEGVTITLPLDVIEQLDKAVDVAMGENPENEEHHQVDVPKTDVSIEVPEGAAKEIDEVADKVLDENLGTETGEEENKEEGSEETGVVETTEVEPTSEGGKIETTEIEPVNIGEEEVKPITTEQTSNLPPALVENIKDKEDGEKPSEVSDKSTQTLEERVEKLEEKSENKTEKPVENKEEKKEKPKETEQSEEKPENKEGKETEVVEEVKEEEKQELADEGEQYKEGKPEMTETSIEDIVKEANTMKPGYIGRTGRVGLDLSGVMNVLNKKSQNINENVNLKSKDRDLGNAKEKAVQQENAQESKDIGKVKDNKTMGEESKFDAKKPEVPTGDALVGKEKEIKEIDPPKIPAGSSAMGEEQLEGGDTRATGGSQGQGNSRAASTRDKLTAMAERIQNIMNKKAEEKKLAPKEPVSKDKDIQPINGDSQIGDEKEVKAIEVKTTDVETKDGFLGKEKETFKDKPSSPKDNPSIPAGGGKFKNEKNVPEKQEKDKGTVIAKSEDGKKIEAEAFRVAGRMLERGQIKADQLASKVSELKGYKMAQLHDIENAMFSAKKGLNTVADGIEFPVVIGEESNHRSSQAELSNKLSSLFTLSKMNKKAQEIDLDFNKVLDR
jgi:hypothetical protein